MRRSTRSIAGHHSRRIFETSLIVITLRPPFHGTRTLALHQAPMALLLSINTGRLLVTRYSRVTAVKQCERYLSPCLQRQLCFLQPMHLLLQASFKFSAAPP